MTIDPLTQKKCKPCEGGVSPLSLAQAQELQQQTPAWNILESDTEEGKAVLKISRTFTFKNFKETWEFFDAVAMIAEEENHHPDFEVHYKSMTLELITHAINGLSENDFIMAAKVDELMK